LTVRSPYGDGRLTPAFDPIADAYDQWYDTQEGRVIFQAELDCLRLLCNDFRGRWLEVGVGTGRFSLALGVGEGIDPSPHMLEKAAQRGIRTYLGTAEHLPFPNGALSGVLMAFTACFIPDAEQALRECARVLRPLGKLLIGTIPADGPWGRAYIRKASEGHPLYSLARFRTSSEILALAGNAGFEPRASASAILWEPGCGRVGEARIESGISQEAAFLGLLFSKASSIPTGLNASEDFA
jgi:ubiquinone/menaquinone biosynthesis C-methylase UbiE